MESQIHMALTEPNASGQTNGVSAVAEPAPWARGTRLLRSHRAAIWLTFGAAAIFCLYRIATFTPGPLDSANTLRPILNRWFLAFLGLYKHPEPAFADWRAFSAFALLVPPALAVLNFGRHRKMFRSPRWAESILCSRTLLFAAIAGCLFVCRYPILLEYQLNPDEGEFLASAHKLFYDGNFFRSVDCGTSGPMNIYPLMLPAIVGLSPDFASSRLIGLLIILASIYLLYRAVGLLASDTIARIAILPPAAAFAVLTPANLVHYSSEHTPLLLVSGALYATVRVLSNPSAYRIPLLLLGLLCSLAFFTKMQSVPMVVTLALIAAAYTYTTNTAGKIWRPVLLLAGGALPLLLLNAILCLATGVWKDFWMSYIVSNQRYADMQSSFVADSPMFIGFLVGTKEVRFFLFTLMALVVVYALQKIRRDPAEQPNVVLQSTAIALVIGTAALLLPGDPSPAFSYMVLMVLIGVPLYFLLFINRTSFGTDPVKWFGLASALLIAASIFSIYKAHRLFQHYLLFLFVPASAAMAWVLIRQTGTSELAHETTVVGTRQRRPVPTGAPGFIFLFVVLTSTYGSYIWGSQTDRQFKNVVTTIRPPEGDFIRSLTSTDGRIVVWGWNVGPYLASGRVPATRDTNMAYLFVPWPEVSSYYRARFLDELRQDPPELFIDAVGRTSWYMRDPEAFGFEQLPDVAAFVKAHFVHLADAYGERYFVRKDLAAKAEFVPLPRTCAAEALRCVDAPAREYSWEAAYVTALQNLTPIKMPAHALIEADFTPTGPQTENATVFNNEKVPRSFHGFRFQNTGGDGYRLILGLGESWAFSKEVLLLKGQRVWLSIELNGTVVNIRRNGALVDEMHLPGPLADSEGPINVGSWIEGQCRFTGTINFFQIRDLSQSH